MKTRRRLLSILLVRIFLGVLVTAGCAKPFSRTEPSANDAHTKIQSRCQASLKLDRLCLTFIWEAYPTETTFGTLLVFLTEESTGFLQTSNLKDPQVKLWMPSMGHGSSPVKLNILQPGILRIEKVFFNMRGDWEVRFQTSTDQTSWSLEF
jgi:hypothetical protein